MTLTLKTTILCSASVAAALNISQLFASYQQREAAFAPAWAQAASQPATTPTPAAKLTAATITAPTPAPSTPANHPPAPTAATAPAAATIAAKLTAAGLNPTYASLYLSVQNHTGTPWQLLAAVHKVESGQAGSTTRTSSAGAVGPMQFLPATFRRYATDGDGDGVTSITDLDDAMLTAGRYLAASGAAADNWSAALYRYNHSNAYVSRVLGLAYHLSL